jgi:hypothetical protein
MSFQYGSIYCRFGCGKPVNNRVMICLPCRKRKCKACGKSFAPKGVLADLCSACDIKRMNLARRLGV